MKITAVIELDTWFEQYEVHHEAESALKEIRRLQQRFGNSDTVTELKLSLSYKNNYGPFTEELSNLGVELKTLHCIDRLSWFYELVTRSTLDGQHSKEDGLIVRIIAGVTMPEVSIIDAMVNNHLELGYHYSRNTPDTTLCPATENPLETSNVELMNLSVLREAWQEALLPDDRSLITPYIYRQQQRLNLGTFPSAKTAILHA